MARDIEEFLRKAAERRQQQKAGGSPQPPQRPAPKQPQARQPLRPENRPPQRPMPSQVPVAKAVPAEPVIVVEQADIIEEPRLAPNFKSSIDTSSVSQHADALGKRVKSTTDRVENAVHKHLDRNVGLIDDTETITDDPSPKIFGAKDMTAVKELRKLLSSKKSVGQAIILAEILKRPDFD